MRAAGDDMDWEALAAYFAGECSTDEAAAVERWIAAEPGRQELVEQLRLLWQDAGKVSASGPATDADAGWRRMAARMRAQRHSPVRGTVRPPELALTLLEPRRRRTWEIVSRVAAALALVAGAGLLWHEVGTRLVQRPPRATQASTREVITRRGERALFTLTDGTKVMLGAESRLTIPASYNSAAAGRRLSLEGEGYFEVTHDSVRPFRVSTTRGVVEDLGTEFVITAYPETDGMQVVVASGRVTLRRPSTQDSTPVATMTPGDLARLDTTGKVTLTRVDPASYLAWTGGALVFDGTPLRDALTRLGRWYDVNIQLADTSLGNQPVTAAFRTESVSQALDIIALSFGLEVERHDRTVILRPKSHPNRSS